MAGAVGILIVLMLIPVALLMTGAVASALIGHLLWRDAEVRHEGSELLDTNV